MTMSDLKTASCIGALYFVMYLIMFTIVVIAFWVEYPAIGWERYGNDPIPAVQFAYCICTGFLIAHLGIAMDKGINSFIGKLILGSGK